MTKANLISVLCLVVATLTGTSIRAEEVFWNNVLGGSFNDPANWSSPALPEVGDDLVFSGPGTYTVDFTTGTTHQSVRILRGDVIFDFDITDPSEDPLDDALRTTKTGSVLSSGVSLRVGGTDVDSPAPRLTITGGTVRTVTTGVSGPRGYNPAVLRIDGPDALLSATGSGVFTTVGSAGEGRLEIINGGSVVSNSVRVGTGTGVVGGHGSVLISGEGSSWTANAFFFANFSNSVDRNSASMVIEDGGFLSVNGLDNREFGATLVTGRGSHWENRGSFDYRAGSITVEDGGRLSGSDMRLGYSNIAGLTSHTSAHVSGRDAEDTASRIDGTTLSLGWAVNGRTAHGLLEVTDGAMASYSLSVSLGRQGANSLGVLSVRGDTSALEVTGTGTSHGIFVGGSSAGAQGRGFVTVADGGVITVAGANGLRLYGDGHLSGNGLVQGDVENGGILAPGMRYTLFRDDPAVKTLTLAQTWGPASTLTIAGDYRQTADGRLDLLLGPTSDRLVVGGEFTFGGTLALGWAEGFDPVGGVSFDLFDFGSGSGAFAAMILPDLDTGWVWDTTQLYASGMIAVSAIPEPGTWSALAGLAALGLAMLRRRRFTVG